jgi:ABC-type dipeptide/oligopeptide/nickel transport system permease subunit
MTITAVAEPVPLVTGSRKRRAVLALVAVLALTAVILVAPTPYDPSLQLADGLSLDGLPLGPSLAHPFGTDTLGRDVLSRAIDGARVSLPVGFAGSLVATAIGTTVGVAAGYFGRAVGAGLMRFTDVIMAFPYLLLAAALQAVIGPGIGNLLLVVGAVTWVNSARVLHGLSLAESSKDYIAALETLGVSRARILFRHLVPNLKGPIIVLYTTGVGYTVLLEATLSYLGLGVQPPRPTWGNMIREGQAYFQTAPWLVIAPGLLLMLTVILVSLAGDRRPSLRSTR